MKLFLLVGLALMGFGLKAFADLQAFRASAARVAAEVVETTAPTKEMRAPREGRVGVRYVYGGRTYERSVTAHDAFWKAQAPGSRVELILNEQNPSKFIAASQLPKSGALGYALIGAGLLVMAAGFFKR